MSRIGKQPIEIPAGVSVSIDPGRVMVNGPLGNLQQQVPARMKIEQAEGLITVARPTERGQDRALHGLTRTLVANMVEGVTKGFEKLNERLTAIEPELARRYPDDIDACMIVAGNEMVQGRAEKALQIFSESIAIDPNNAGIYNQIGYYYAWRGDYDKAMENPAREEVVADDIPVEALVCPDRIPEYGSEEEDERSRHPTAPVTDRNCLDLVRPDRRRVVGGRRSRLHGTAEASSLHRPIASALAPGDDSTVFPSG